MIAEEVVQTGIKGVVIISRGQSHPIEIGNTLHDPFTGIDILSFRMQPLITEDRFELVLDEFGGRHHDDSVGRIAIIILAISGTGEEIEISDLSLIRHVDSPIIAEGIIARISIRVNEDTLNQEIAVERFELSSNLIGQIPAETPNRLVIAIDSIDPEEVIDLIDFKGHLGAGRPVTGIVIV